MIGTREHIVMMSKKGGKYKEMVKKMKAKKDKKK